jgi:hypothetical protein
MTFFKVIASPIKLCSYKISCDNIKNTKDNCKTVCLPEHFGAAHLDMFGLRIYY